MLFSQSEVADVCLNEEELSRNEFVRSHVGFSYIGCDSI